MEKKGKAQVKNKITNKNNAWRTPNLGTACKMTSKGPLFLEFSETSILALRSGPAPCAWFKSSSTMADSDGSRIPGWRGLALPPIEIGKLLRQMQAAEDIPARRVRRKDLPYGDRPSHRIYEKRRRESFAKFLEPVPAEIIEEMRQRYPGWDWPLFRLLCLSEAAREACAQGDRALMFALASAAWLNVTQRASGKAFFTRWAPKKRRALAARLGFPDRKASMQILRKLHLPNAGFGVLRLLRENLAHDSIFKMYCHLEEIRAAHVHFLQPEFIPYMRPSFIQSLSSVDNQWRAVDLMREARDLLRLQRQMGLGAARWSSVETVRQRHDELVSLARTRMDYVAASLPPSPVSLEADEEKWISPLQSGWALLEEGKRQHHCLGTLAYHQEEAIAGRFYAWSIHGAERATLALHDDGQFWRVYDVRGPCNAEVSESMNRLAWSFVERANKDRVPRGVPLQRVFHQPGPNDWRTMVF